MIQHIVMHRLKSDVSTEMRQTLKAQAEQLAEKIPEIHSLAVRMNSPEANPQNYDIALIAEFLSMEDLETYRVHPAHVAYGNLIRPLRESRACIDFEQ